MPISIYPAASAGVVTSVTQTVTASAPTGTINFDVNNGDVLVYTQASTGNITVNFRGNSSSAFTTVAAVGDTKTYTLIFPIGTSTVYEVVAVQIDGAAQTPVRTNAVLTPPSLAQTVAYTFTIRRTGTSTYSVIIDRVNYTGIPVVSTSGATTSSDATYYYAVFTGSGSLTVSNAPIALDYVIQAGGAGAGRGNGNFGGGGGGAGGCIYGTNQTIQPGTYTASIGGGGAGTTSTSSTGGNGGNTTMFNLTAIGGGGGAATTNGAAGGCGGGAAGNTFTGGSGTTNQGYKGGNVTGMNGAGSNQVAAAPGGGIGGAGKDITTADGNSSTNGGNGLTLLGYAIGGGGGGGGNGTSTSINGGGIGTSSGTAGGNATANTGSGGGGGGYQSSSGGNGGSGIVIVRWPRSAIGG